MRCVIYKEIKLDKNNRKVVVRTIVLSCHGRGG